MPRRREVPKREILPDPKYHNVELAKFVNVLMTRGKKSVAESIIYRALSQIEKKTGSDPMAIFTQALTNVRPIVEVKSRRVGGANYQVPVEVRSVRRNALAMRWLRDAARKEVKSLWMLDLQVNCQRLPKVVEGRLRNVRKCTEWQSLIKRFRISVSNFT